MASENLFSLPWRLRRLQIEITTGCNLRCAGCQRTLGMAAGTWHNAHMPVDRFTAVLANAPGADAIILQGIGEPTLHPSLPELIRLAAATGRFGVVSFNTNALARETEYYQTLRAAGLGHISVSVDSLRPDTAEALRAGTDTDRLRTAIGALAALFQGSLTLSIVLSRRNLPELAALLAELHGLGGRLVEVQPLVSYDAAIDPLALTDADRRTALAVIEQARARHPDLTILPAAALTPNGSRCRRPFHAAYVTAGGFLTPCCVTNDTALMGRTSLAETSWEMAWHGDGVRGFTAAFLDREPAICRGCAFNPAGNPAGARAAVAAALVARGQDALRSGDHAAAAERFRTLVADPAQLEALQGLGVAHLLAGKPDAAVPLLRARHQLAPEPRSAHNLAVALTHGGAAAEAVAIEQATVTAHPEYVPAWHGLAAAQHAAGDATAAAGTVLGLAERAVTAGDARVAAAAAQAAAGFEPLHPAVPRVANRLRIAGHADAALHLLDARLARDPADLGALLSRAMTHLHVVHASAAAMAASRARYLDDLAAVERVGAGAAAQDLARGAAMVGTAKPFYLSYHGEDDTDAQRLYGRIISRMMAAHAPPFGLVRQPAGGPVRVGFATAYFHLHSVSKLFGGWLRGLDPARFTLFGYHLGDGEDALSAELAGHCHEFRRGPRDDAGWAGAIAADRLDVLIYPEIGMHPTAVRLACLRLAPVQCVAWGHPVTTGLPTIDYFLSSALMEPADGDRHYTETLVRLPNLSIQYHPPPADTGALSRTALGLPDSAIVYLCCQSLPKYHPADDAIPAAIAARVPDARFVFIGTPAGDANAALLQSRLRAAFGSAGMDADRHLHFVPPVPAAEFPALLRLSDIYLDSCRWSGGNTTLEAMAAGLPIVTLPGPMMRGRHSAAILRLAGAAAWIAASAEDYVEKAVALADPAERVRAAAAIKAGRAQVFGDPTPVAALATFLETVARGQRTDAAA